MTQITPASGSQQPEDQLEDRRLPGAAGAEDDLRVPLDQREADFAEDHLVVEGQRHLVEDDDRRAWRIEDLLAVVAARRSRPAAAPACQYISEISRRVMKKSTASTATEAATTAFVVGTSDALRAATRPQADVAADADDGEAEEERLDETHPGVLPVQALEHRGPVDARRDAQLKHGDHPAADDADESPRSPSARGT